MHLITTNNQKSSRQTFLIILRFSEVHKMVLIVVDYYFSKMKILFNQTDFFLKGNTIKDLLKESKSDKTLGFVVVVNQKVVLKNQWDSFQLQEADVVLTVLPIQGG